MISRRGAIGLIVGGAASALGGCDALKPDDVVRYRMTVEVMTPQGLRTGQSVVESRIEHGVSFGSDAPGISYKLRGEAVAVDLGDGRVLFALLRGAKNSDGPAYYAYLLWQAFSHGARTEPMPPADLLNAQSTPLRKWARRHDLQLDLPREAYPLLVTFRDTADPTSVERVDPADLAATFGPGFELRRITAEITNGRVTSGIAKRLTWLSRYYDRMLDGQRLNNSRALSNNIKSDNFSTEIFQMTVD